MASEKSAALDALHSLFSSFGWSLVLVFVGRLRERLRTRAIESLQVRENLNNKEAEMLDGKEVDVKIGNVGSVSIDIDDKGIVKAAVSFEIDLLEQAQKLAAKSGTSLDDSLVAALKKLMGRE